MRDTRYLVREQAIIGAIAYEGRNAPQVAEQWGISRSRVDEIVHKLVRSASFRWKPVSNWRGPIKGSPLGRLLCRADAKALEGAGILTGNDLQCVWETMGFKHIPRSCRDTVASYLGYCLEQEIREYGEPLDADLTGWVTRKYLSRQPARPNAGACFGEPFAAVVID